MHNAYVSLQSFKMNSGKLMITLAIQMQAMASLTFSSLNRNPVLKGFNIA